MLSGNNGLLGDDERLAIVYPYNHYEKDVLTGNVFSYNELCI